MHLRTHTSCNCHIPGIRYPEELSFCKPLTQDDLKHNYSEKQMKKKPSTTVKNGTPADTNSFISNKSHNSTNGSLDRSHHNNTLNTSSRTPISSPVSSWRWWSWWWWWEKISLTLFSLAFLFHFLFYHILVKRVYVHASLCLLLWCPDKEQKWDLGYIFC